MLAGVAIFFYFAARIIKRIKTVYETPQRFLVYYLMGA
jgi:phosphate starvation-inducible membrane PsiE